MPFELVRNDITMMQVDAVVNAANTRLQAGGGVCGAIFARAGSRSLQKACDAIGHCDVGEAVITPGFDLPASYVIHTPGPVWQGGGYGEERLLKNCYINSLKLAHEHGLNSVAFPLISSGIFGYPKRQALSVAVSAISQCLLEWDMQVYLVIFDRDAFMLSEKLYASIQSFIDDRYVLDKEMLRPNWADEVSFQIKSMLTGGRRVPSTAEHCMRLEDIVATAESGFSAKLFEIIDAKGLTDPQVYKRANLDRKLFSKIRSNPCYHPGKNTVLALCVALELNLEEAKALMGQAGFAFSPSSKSDLIVEFFIRKGNYNIFEINEALFAFDQCLLGSNG